jgi:hypothetical protein
MSILLKREEAMVVDGLAILCILMATDMVTASGVLMVGTRLVLIVNTKLGTAVVVTLTAVRNVCR